MLKTIHIITAILSITGFIFRGFLMIRGSSMLKNIWVKVLPHINDTILLGTAIAMVIMYKMYPIQQHWLTAKVIALLVYIYLGFMAFRFGKSKTAKTVFWLLAIAVFIYIVAVARTKNVLVFL